MTVKRAELNDYRNYAHTRVDFCGGINVLCGDNAQGKTNLLEAIYFCGVGRSPRTPRDKELIKKGCDRGRIFLTQEDRGGENTVEILLDRTQNKRVAVNGMPILRMGELMGVVAAVYFSPDEMRIIKDAPGDRRRFTDIALCRMSRPYFYLLGRYNKVLLQRNRLLKSGKATDDVLDVWDAQLVTEGAKVTKTRRRYIERLNAHAREAHAFLTDGKEELLLRYEGCAGEDTDEIAANFAAELKRNRERDKQLCYTSCGVQKDDVAVSIGARLAGATAHGRARAQVGGNGIALRAKRRISSVAPRRRAQRVGSEPTAQTDRVRQKISNDFVVHAFARRDRAGFGRLRAVRGKIRQCNARAVKERH